MPVKIRLQRHGKKGRPFFHIVVADSRAPRDGRFIERIGNYNPITDPATIEINSDRALDWLMKGAQPSDTAKAILSYKGILYRTHLAKGVQKGSFTQEQADEKFSTWTDAKANKIENKKSRISSDRSKAMNTRLEQESKVNAARIDAIRKKEAEGHLAAQPAEEVTETPAENTSPAEGETASEA